MVEMKIHSRNVVKLYFKEMLFFKLITTLANIDIKLLFLNKNTVVNFKF